MRSSAHLTFCLLAGSVLWGAEEKLQFNRDIRPILSENCFFCHGQDPKHREAKLRLDLRDEATRVRDGTAAIVPGHPEKSELIKRLISHDADEKMPPPESHRIVSTAQIALLRRWITEGADYQKHWAFIAPQRAALPETKNNAWAKQPFDRYVLARLERENLSPSLPVAPEIWLRRASFDLTGLPASPAELDTFITDVAQRGDAAYTAAADRLLASPHFGERLALDWLDTARYADTHGFNNDSGRSMWRWRDYVIESFNANLPFDRFVTEQLAGDLLPQPSLDQRIATGFSRNHVINSEGGIIDEEYRVEYVADRVRTTSTALLGLTMECARCHDHKFDPITQQDFYQLFAFFNNVVEYGEDGRVANAVPLLITPTREQTVQLQKMSAQLSSLDHRLKGVTCDEALLPDLLKQAIAEDAKLGARPQKPLAPDAKATAANKVLGSRFTAKSADVDPKRGTTLAFWFKPTADNGPDTPLLNALDRSGNPAATTYGSGRELRLVGQELEWHASVKFPVYATLVRTVGAQINSNHWHHVVVIITGKETAEAVQIFVNGEEIQTHVVHDGLSGVPGARDWIVGNDGAAPPYQGEINGMATYPAVLKPAEIRATFLARALLTPTEFTAGTTAALHRQAKPANNLQTEHDGAWTDLLAFRRTLPTTMVMQEMPQPRQAFVLNRGQYDQHGAKVSAGVPETLIAPWPQGAPRNRLGLAQWFLQPNHPLTARVTVNRFWAQLFGIGLVKTVEDFGTQGEWPSHLEVLDLLARDFIDGGWNVKAFYKSVVTSATYRQTSAAGSALYARDPENRLLGRGPRLRLPAELIRDQALTVAGLLARKIGGPSVRPYQPEGLYKGIVVDAPYPSTTWVQGTGDDLYRRSLYTFWKRTVPHPVMITFDTPDREFCSARRARTNTPLQALALWNETGYLEASRKLGERMLKEGGSNDSARLGFAFRLATGRMPRADETAILLRTLTRLRADYLAHPADAAAALKIGVALADPKLNPVELAAYAGIANVILTLDETITKN